MTPEEFRALGHRMVDWVAEYYGRVGELPVLSQVSPGDVERGLPLHAPEQGEAWDAIFEDVERVVLPGVTHWQSPSFFAFFPCNSSGPGMLGEILSAGLNVNGMLWATSPAATELETRVMDWMGELIGLPESFLSGTPERRGAGGGVIQGTASESTLVAMLAARHRAVRGGADAERLVVYASREAHSSVVKAAMICGLADGADDRRRVRLIEVDERMGMRVDALEVAMREDVGRGLVPCYVCATLGTTSSLGFDPVGAIGEVIERVGAECWLHVDAAHAGCACVCEEQRWMLEGIGRADSICFNPHKWLLTNFDCDCLFTRDREAIIGALSVTPEYLRNRASASGEVFDYRDWQVPLGRRFRALKLWFVIRHYGAEGLRASIRGHIALTELFERLVGEDDRFEVLLPRSLNLVCFGLRAGNEASAALLERVNASGEAYLTHTVLKRGDEEAEGRYALRMVIGSPQTREEHVRAAWALLQREAEGVIAGGQGDG